MERLATLNPLAEVWERWLALSPQDKKEFLVRVEPWVEQDESDRATTTTTASQGKG